MRTEGGLDLKNFITNKQEDIRDKEADGESKTNYYSNTLVSLVVALYGAIALYAFNVKEYDILNFILLLVVSGSLWLAILVSVVQYIKSDKDISNIIIVACFFFSLSVMTFLFLSSYYKNKNSPTTKPQKPKIEVDIAKCKFSIPYVEEGFTLQGKIKNSTFTITQKPYP